MPDMVAVVGMLVGFLVVGVIGIYVGDQMIQAANISIPNGDANLYKAQTEVIKTFDIGVNILKIVVIVSVGAIIIALLQVSFRLPRPSRTRPSSSGNRGTRAGSGSGNQTLGSSASEPGIPYQEPAPQQTSPSDEAERGTRAGALEFEKVLGGHQTDGEKVHSRAQALEFGSQRGQGK